MIESGVGRAHNIAMSTQPGFIWPGDVSASQRYWEEDIIEPEVEVTPAVPSWCRRLPASAMKFANAVSIDLTVRHESYSARPESVAVLE